MSGSVNPKTRPQTTREDEPSPTGTESRQMPIDMLRSSQPRSIGSASMHPPDGRGYN
jgi:hypothetical protein